MNGLKDLAHAINEHFRLGAFKCSAVFAGFKFWEIAESTSKAGETGSFPGIYHATGDIDYPGIDEDHPGIIYHRVTGMSFQNQPRASYGDQINQLMTASMRMAVYIDRRRIPMTGDELGLFLYSNFPAAFHKIPNFGNVVVRIINVIPNNSAAFQNEYPGATFFLKPEHVLININYQLESIIKKDCFNICPK